MQPFNATTPISLKRILLSSTTEDLLSRKRQKKESFRPALSGLSARHAQKVPHQAASINLDQEASTLMLERAIGHSLIQAGFSSASPESLAALRSAAETCVSLPNSAHVSFTLADLMTRHA